MPTAVVTGAGRGIGRATAVALLDAGYRVALVGRTRATLDEALASASRPSAGLTVQADVADEGQVTAEFEHIEIEFGRIDLLFNNAGRFGPSGRFEETAFEAWREILDVNLDGAFLCARAAYRVMLRQDPPGGRIINNGSLSAHVPRPGAVAYTASKHAISGLTKAIALEGRGHGITCGQIDIGNAATDLTAKMSTGVRQADGRMMPEPTIDVAHVAAAVLCMAGLPLDANVPTMTVMATGMPYVGRG